MCLARVYGFLENDPDIWGSKGCLEENRALQFVVDFHEPKGDPTVLAAIWYVQLCGIVVKHVNSSQTVDSSCRGSLTAHVIYLHIKLRNVMYFVL